MKKIGEATILIVADVILLVSFSIRVSYIHCSYFEQSSLKKGYHCGSVFFSLALYHYSPLKFATGISLYLKRSILKNIASTFLLNPYSLPRA
jgi:hypothetical protein